MRFEAKGPPQHAIQFCWRNGSNHPQSFEPIGFVSQTTAPRPSVAPYGSNIAVTNGSAAVEATSPWSQRREQLHCSPWLVLQARVAASDPQCSAPAERCVELKGGRFSRAGLLLLCLLSMCRSTAPVFIGRSQGRLIQRYGSRMSIIGPRCFS
jgi:hypothetical protein